MSEIIERHGHSLHIPEGWEEVTEGKIKSEHMFYNGASHEFEVAQGKWKIGSLVAEYICIIKKIDKPQIKPKINKNPKGLSRLALIAVKRGNSYEKTR